MLDIEAVQTRLVGAAITGVLAVLFGAVLIGMSDFQTLGLLFSGYLIGGVGVMLLQACIVVWLLTAGGDVD